jgi:zinc protease
MIGNTLSANPDIQIKNMNDQMPLNPKVVYGKLENGITYYVMENKKPENRAELHMVVKAGSLLEDDDQSGLAHFIEHMCFNGTKNFPKNDLIKFLEGLGMKFGAELNANTGFDRTYYMLTIPLDKPGVLDSGFQVLEDWLHYVSFDNEELEKERGVIMEEWRLYLSANQRMMLKHFPHIFYKSKYVDRLPIGDTAVIQHAPRQRFLDYYNDWYRPDLTAIIAVGDFNAQDIVKMIKEKFSDVPNPKNPKKVEEYPLQVHNDTKISIAQDKEMQYTMIASYFKHLGKPDLSYGHYRQSIINRMVSAIISSRLTELTKKPNPPFLFANAAQDHLISNMNTFYINAVVKEDSFADGLLAAYGEAFRALQHGITQTELDRQKKEMMSFIEKAHKEKDKTESSALAHEMGRNFNDSEAAPGIDIELALYKMWLPEITVDDLNKVLKNALKKENLTIAVSAPEKEGLTLPNEKEILAIYEKAAGEKYEPYIDKVSSSPLFNKKVSKGKIVAETKIEELGITELKLSNGIKVVLKPTDFKNDEIIMQAFSPGGNSLVEDNNYISAAVAQALIDEAGISEFDQTQLEKLLQGKIVRINPIIGRMTEGFSGGTTPQDLETLLQLTHLYFTDPRKDDDAFQSYMAKMKEQLKNAQLNPKAAFSDTLTTVMSSYHFRSRPMSEELLNEVNYDKAFEIYKDRFMDASDFTFIFVGAFTIDEIKPMLQQYLGSLPSKKRIESAKDVGERYPKGAINKEVYKGIEKQSSVRVVFTGDFNWNDDERFVFDAMLNVLNIRMREAIREDKGGTYGVYSFGRPSQYPTSTYRIDIGFGTSPDKVDELVTTLYDLIKDMQKNNVEDKYINDIKEMIKRQFETNSKQNNFWLRQIYDGLYNGDDLKKIVTNVEKADKLTAEDVRKAMEKYFNFNDVAKFVLYPEKN